MRTGLDVWIEGGPQTARLPSGARIGLLAHPASIDRSARHVLEHVAAGRFGGVVRLFAPEHGLWGHEQDMEEVESAVEPWTGLPAISLYGRDARSLRPTPATLDGLDALVVDLQDVGSRYYTFVYTLAYVMEAAGAAGLPVIVLDRPNPIGGTHVEGPVLRPELVSFVGRYPLPVRHGMTIGELAGLFRGEFGVDCDLRVVRLEGWRRGDGFTATGLPWAPPSPNMPTPTTALVYPGGCLIEGTNLSEARGTTMPFELVGAPWLDARKLAERMRVADLPGVAFRPASFRPMFQKHARQPCHGVQVVPTDPETFQPFATYLALLREARSLSAAHFMWRTEIYEFEAERPAIDYLFGRPELRERIEAGDDVDEMQLSWDEDLRAFERMRRRYLLYDA